MSFKVEHEYDLDDLENKVQQWGYPVRRVSKGESVGQGESIRFETPSGQQMELVHDIEMVGRATASVNPAPVRRGPQGHRAAAPRPRARHRRGGRRLGEVLHGRPRLPDDRAAARRRRATRPRCGWRRSHSPHDLAIVTGPNGGLHHFACWLDDWDHVRRSADILAYNGIQIDVGPTRHGITRGNTIYFFDPLGTRNEVFTGGYRPDPDFPTITWTEDNIGRAVFYYEGELNQRFMSVHT